MLRYRFGLRYLIAAVTLCAVEMAAIRVCGSIAVVALPFLGALLGALLVTGADHRAPLRQAITAAIFGTVGLFLANLFWRIGWPEEEMDNGLEGSLAFNLFQHVLGGGGALVMIGVSLLIFISTWREWRARRNRFESHLAFGWTLVVGWYTAFAWLLSEQITIEGPWDAMPFLGWFFISLFVGTAFGYAAAIVVVPIVLKLFRHRARGGFVLGDSQQQIAADGIQ